MGLLSWARCPGERLIVGANRDRGQGSLSGGRPYSRSRGSGAPERATLAMNPSFPPPAPIYLPAACSRRRSFAHSLPMSSPPAAFGKTPVLPVLLTTPAGGRPAFAGPTFWIKAKLFAGRLSWLSLP
jgi:hypothetical protein